MWLTSTNSQGQYLLEVRWRGDVAEEAFTIKCRTDELLKQWQRTIQKAVDENPTGRKRAAHLSGRRSERGFNSPLSQFPGTPMSEAGPSNASIYSLPSQPDYSPYPYTNTAQPSYPPHCNGFDDEGDDQFDQPESGRTTPNTMARRTLPNRSLPPGEREDRQQGRPRAQTEDSSSAVINQWRSQTPSDSFPVSTPSLPRGASHGSDSHSLRSSASSRQLKGKPSSEWGYGVVSAVNTPGSNYSRMPGVSDDDGMTPRSGGVQRQGSSASAHIPTVPVPVRSRSASSPNMYQGSPNPEQEWNHPYAHPGDVPSVPSLSMSHKSAGATNSAGTLASASSASTNKKRFSSSSNGTDRSSGTSSQSNGVGQSTATSPSTTVPGSLPPSAGLPPLPNGSRSYPGIPNSPTATAVRVKVTYGDDTFVVVVLSSVTHHELLEKVLKKIRMCGDRTLIDASALRLRYQDEDGDRILITSEEDVMMAFEAVRAMSHGPTQTLVLYASVDSSR